MTTSLASTTTTTSSTMTTSSSTAARTTTTTTGTTTTTIHIRLIDGLTPDESAVYNPHLASYWDLDHCGKASNNHHWDWCWNGEFECQSSVLVSPALCASGEATLNFTRQLANLDGCTFGFYGQYTCIISKTTTTGVLFTSTTVTSATATSTASTTTTTTTTTSTLVTTLAT